MVEKVKYVLNQRKVAMIVHSCPKFPHIENLPYLKLFFLLQKNITSVAKAMDCSVIRLVNLILCNLEHNK